MSLVRWSWMEEGIAQVELADPARLNAMGEAMATDFGQVVAGLSAVRPRVVVLCGQGGSFSAGGDLAMLEAKQSRAWTQNMGDMLAFYWSFLQLLRLEVPLVAAVQGWAVGAGCCLAAACDLRLADPGARFRVPFVQMGLFPGMGTTLWFRQRMGPWAADFLLRGTTLNAEQAAQRGLVTEISAPGEVLSLALAQGREILRSGPEATRDLLRLLRPDPAELQLALAREADLQARSYNREEFAQGLQRARART